MHMCVCVYLCELTCLSLIVLDNRKHSGGSTKRTVCVFTSSTSRSDIHARLYLYERGGGGGVGGVVENTIPKLFIKFLLFTKYYKSDFFCTRAEVAQNIFNVLNINK